MNKRMLIKICGLKDPENAANVAELGIDYAGFIFYPKSPRFAEGDVNANLVEKLKSICIPVAVFVDEKPEKISEVVRSLGFNSIQLHGDEGPDYCAQVKEKEESLTLIKAFRISEDFDFEKTQVFEGKCDLFLFDNAGKGKGGSGEKFNWDLLASYKGATPFILSGGIGPGDLNTVKEAWRKIPKLEGIDLNSRFETSPGIKSVEALQSFLEELRS